MRYCHYAWVLLLALALGCQQSTSTETLTLGTPLPTLHAQGWINGPAPDSAALAGRVVVLDLWAYW